MAAPDILNLPTSVTLQAGAPLQIALDGVDADGDALTYTFSIPTEFQDDLAAELRMGKSVEIEVEHASSGAGDPAFTGSMLFQLFEDLAPRTTEQFLTLAERNPSFFEDIIFHRVIENFVIQGGDPTGTGSGGSNLSDFDDEFHADLQHTARALLSMAKSEDDTNNSQFFVTLDPARHLDFNHSIFGMLVEGDAVLEQIANVAVSPNDPSQPESPQNPRTRPTSPVTMTDVTVSEDIQNGAFTLKTLDNSFTGMVNVNVTVSDGTSQVTKTIAVNVVADTTENQPFLQPINPITTMVNTPVTVTIPFTDVDGGSAAIFEIDNEPPNPNLGLSIDPATGVLTVTPQNGLVGVHHVLVGVRNATSGFDVQDVPIYISPAAPGTPNLADASDTGGNTTDNITRLDNSTTAGVLQFTVGNVVAGAEVRLMVGNSVIGQAIVPTGATSVTIPTNGSFDLTDGQHTITAVQMLNDQDVDVGNLETTVDLTSTASQAVTLTVDTTPPVITSTAVLEAQVGASYTYNVQSAEEGSAGFVYALVESPTGATINFTTGVISWVPSAAQEGDQEFTVRATDPAGNTVDQEFTVSVDPSDTAAPEIATITDKTVDAEDLLTFVVTATDEDTDEEELVFSLTSAPAGATIDPDTGEVRWTPTAAQGGQTHTITVRVSDGTNIDEETFDVNVIPRPTTFKVVNGDLIVAGTPGNDQLTISGTEVLGQYTVSGSLGTETVNGVIAGIQLNLGDGDDQVTLNNIYAAGSIVIDLGEGDDVARLGRDATVSSAQNLSINFGGGNDQLHMQRVYIAGDQTIDGGAGDDMLVIAGFAEAPQFWLGSSSAGATTLQGGEGDDSMQVSYSFVVGPLTMDGGNGNDAISLVASATSGGVMVTGLDGHDLLAIDTNYFVTTLVLNGGTGSDILLLKNSIVLQSATLSGADGSDSTEVNNAIMRGLMINAGTGHDAVAIRASLMENLFADLGDGDDSLILHANRIFGRADVEGGPGLSDRLSDQGNLMHGARKRRFELFG